VSGAEAGAGISLQRITASNAALLNDVANDVFDDIIDAARVWAFLARPEHLLIVAVAEQPSGRPLVVGQIAAMLHHHVDAAPDLYIDNLGVAPDFRRRGIARELVEAVMALGRSLGGDEAWVLTEADNDAARALYRERGAEAQAVVMFEYDL
jgi:aminoglycoside 6'-N-acetyltransferase I